MMKSRLLGRLIYHSVALLLAILFLLPVLWLFAASLRSPGLPPPRDMEWIPSPRVWNNYRTVFEMVPLGRYIFNSLLIVTGAVPLTLLTASWAGFGMAGLNRKERHRFLILSVGYLIVPVTALWLTRYLLFSWAGLIDSYWPMLAPALMGSSPLFILLFYWTFRRIPSSVIESARLDGAGPLQVWWNIALPQARPTIMAVMVLTFLLYWNDFIQPLLYLKSPERYTLAVGLRQLQQLDQTNWPILLAAAVVMTVPALLLFLLVQRYFLHEESFLGGRK